MDNQVLDWLYEYCIKQDYGGLCSSIEAEFKKRGRVPEIPKSGFLLFIRRLQITLHGDQAPTKADLETIVCLLHDILRYEPFHKCFSFHKAVIKLLIVTKLWLVDEGGLHHDLVLKHLPYFNWDSVKSDFQYQDDYFKEHYAKFITAAHEAIEACADKQTSNPNHLIPRLRRVIENCLQEEIPKLRAVLMTLIPSTALEKLINSAELRETFAIEGGPEFQILLNFTRKGVTESVIREVMQALLTMHATISENPQTVSELRTAKNENISVGKAKSKELNQICVDAEDISLEREIHCTSSKESSGDHEVVIVNGQIKYMKKSIIHPVKICELSRLKKKRKIIATHKNTDDLCDKEQNTNEMPVSPEDLYVITVNSKQFEVVSKENLVPVRKPSRSYKDQKTSHMQKSHFTENCMEASDIQELESMITTLENFLSLLKMKLKQEKGKRAAAGLQSFIDEHSNSGDEDGDHLDHCHAGTSHASLITEQQLTHQNSRIKNDHQAHNSSVENNKNHNPLDSQNWQNCGFKISPSEKFLMTVASDLHDLEREMRSSPLESLEDKSQRNKPSDHESSPLASLSPCQMSCSSDQNALHLCLSDSSDTLLESEFISEASYFQLVKIDNTRSQDTSLYQKEILGTFMNDKENKRPVQSTSHAQNNVIAESRIPSEALSPPDLSLESLHLETNQECVSNSRKEDAVCNYILPSTVINISSSRIKQNIDFTPTNKGKVSPKQNVLQSKRQTRANTRQLREEKAEGENLQLYYDSDDLATKTKTKPHVSVTKYLKKKCKSNGTKHPSRLKLKEMNQGLKHEVTLISSECVADSSESDTEAYLTPTNSPDPGTKLSPFRSSSHDISDAESWVSARNSMASSEDIKTMKPLQCLDTLHEIGKR
ncbi:uncharacterized protein [Panulirus ornatus]|uniref:uncharacterized protein n=1 Tax=Panulirus ornatus TaxID=150431 RepID=UPI003A884C1E